MSGVGKSSRAMGQQLPMNETKDSEKQVVIS
jgi:hypothetical protein